MTRILNAIRHRADADVQMTHSTIVWAHQHATCIKHGDTEDLGRSRGGVTIEILAAVNANGLPSKLALAAGHHHDSLSATELLNDLPEGGMLLADKAYDSNAIRSLVTSRGARANIPPRSNRRDPICCSPYVYRDRNFIMRFFNRIKRCRRIAPRYKKRAANFLALVKLAAISALVAHV